jgi:hypothetical protein
LNCF